MLAIFYAQFFILIVVSNVIYTNQNKIFFHYFSALISLLAVVLGVRHVILYYLDTIRQHSDMV